MSQPLEVYIDGYAGPMLLKRLHHIASKCPALASDASKLALKQLMSADLKHVNFKGVSVFQRILTGDESATELLNQYAQAPRLDSQAHRAMIESEITQLATQEDVDYDSVRSLYQSKLISSLVEGDEDWRTYRLESGYPSRKYLTRNMLFTVMQMMYVDSPEYAIPSLRQTALMFAKMLSEESDDVDDSMDPISEDEVIGYWNCRWVNLFLNFCCANLTVVVKEYQRLVEAPAVKGHDAISVLQNHYDSTVISRDGLLICVFLSALVALSLDDFEELAGCEVFEHLFAGNSLISSLANAFAAAEYRETNLLLGKLVEELAPDPFFYRLMPAIQKRIRQKEYVCYLLLMQRVSVSDLAEFVGVDQDFLLKELVYLITAPGLHLELDTASNIVSYKPVSETNDLEILFEKIELLNLKSKELEESAGLKNLVLATIQN